VWADGLQATQNLGLLDDEAPLLGHRLGDLLSAREANCLPNARLLENLQYR
jgi:hypothetical protein